MRALTTILTLAIFIGFASDTLAKKREPDKRTVEKTLQKAGGEHWVEDMKVKDVGTIEVGDDEYYHVFSGKLPDDAGYHLIIFDNTPAYVGFYKIAFEPAEVGEDAIMIDTGDFDPVTEGPLYKQVALDSSGPEARIQINGVPSKFVKAPEPEVASNTQASSGSMASAPSSSSQSAAPEAAKKKPEYRSWNITIGEKVIKVESAIFVNLKNGQVTIQDAKTGKKVTKPISDFSEEDKEYLKDLLQ